MMGGGRLLTILVLVPLLWAPTTSAQRQNATMTIPELEELLTRNTWSLSDSSSSLTVSFTPNKTFARKASVPVSFYDYGTWEVSTWCWNTCLSIVTAHTSGFTAGMCCVDVC
jgi:hypothetical protein